MEFKDWITRKYVEWRGDKIGREGSASSYSLWLGVNPSLLSQWMSGDRTATSAQSINALVSRYGGEVYDILDIQPPSEPIDAEDTDIRAVVEIMKSATPAKRREISFAVRAMASIDGAKIVKSKGEGSSNDNSSQATE